jgi:hypothetical protein
MLHLANALILAGLAPFVLSLYSVTILTPLSKNNYGIEADGFLSVAMLLTAYAIMLIVSGLATAWSAKLTKDYINLYSRFSRALRILAYILLAIPALWFAVTLAVH